MLSEGNNKEVEEEEERGIPICLIRSHFSGRQKQCFIEEQQQQQQQQHTNEKKRKSSIDRDLVAGDFLIGR